MQGSAFKINKNNQENAKNGVVELEDSEGEEEVYIQ